MATQADLLLAILAPDAYGLDQGATASSTKTNKVRSSILASSLWFLLMFGHPTELLAQGWERLADGRIVIVIKGHKFALPSEGYDADNIRFDDASLQDRAMLPEVIAAPESAKAIFERRPNVIISTGVGPGKSLFWNMYDRESVQSLLFSFGVGENQKECQGWAAEFEKVRATPSNESGQDSAPWREFHRGNATIYTYIGPRPGGIRSSLQDLVCDKLSYCSSSVCLAPDLGFNFSFWSKAFPQEKWLELLKKVDAILARITELPADSKGEIR
jgi:hypothetical protein